MVLSNLSKGSIGGQAWRMLGIALRAAPLILLACWALLSHDVRPQPRRFLIGWLGAAFIGFALVPNFYGHYALPLLVPLSVAAGLSFGLLKMRLVYLVAAALYAMVWTSPLQGRETRLSIQQMEIMAQIVDRRDSGGGLLVFDGPHALYSMTGKRFLSPLVFPHHLNHAIENDVSHIGTQDEIRRILANRPGVIVIARFAMNHPVNAVGRAAVLRYARTHCRSKNLAIMRDNYIDNPMVIFGDCTRN